MNDETTSQICARLARLDSSVVSDVLDEAGWCGRALSSTISPLDPSMKFAGPALCFRGRALQGDTVPEALSSYVMDESVFPGGVVVIDAGDDAIAAAIGGLIAISLQLRGCAGVLVNGGVRDAGEIVGVGLATFARFATPLNSSGRWALLDQRTPIDMPGQDASTVTVSPGDLILADRDGVVVVPQEIAEPVVIASEQLVAIEEQIVAQLRDGKDRQEVFSTNPRFRHVKTVMADFGHGPAA